MPRLPTSLLNHARSLHPYLPLLLRSCRDLSSAQNELRWLREHYELLKFRNPEHLHHDGRGSLPKVEQVLYRSRFLQQNSTCSLRTRNLLRIWCRQRSRGMPLQYILGSQPFGAVDVLCRREVLIPRPETEAYTIRIANLILGLLDGKPSDGSVAWPANGSVFRSISRLRILDLCTGTGCIPLLLHAIISARVSRLDIVGVDISSAAIALARKNLHHNIAQGLLPLAAENQIQFLKADIFDDNKVTEGDWDIVISNPPYISPQSFNKNTSRSVRNYEPKIALLPLKKHSDMTTQRHEEAISYDSTIADSFYPQILRIANRAKARMLLVEVADFAQAQRVAGQGIKSGHWQRCEIWRDYWPPAENSSSFKETTTVSGVSVRVSGEGHGRSVLFTSPRQR